ncbi:MAG: Cyclopropane-fatty-acyl-phospholipid synthase-like protein clusters with [Acidimicrobiales bacterium]|nr:Cyclopropane-fatty-acyl-phospholipid synthase-like protein clusters with [Acidimicrobiales bacterium]
MTAPATSTPATTAAPAPLATPIGFRLLDWGLVPDALLRAVCTLRTRNRLNVERRGTLDERSERMRRLRGELRTSAVTTHTAEANAQHYEVPSAFFSLVLGPRLKYSSSYWPEGVTTLGAAEEAMLELYGQRAELADGQRVLEMGCGWGSFTLWAAERYPRSEIVGVSNSRSQRDFVLARAAERGLSNVSIITADIADFDPADHGQEEAFDRVVSIEMLEHVRNHERLFARVAHWLADDGRFFTHIFTGRDVCFRYDADDPRDWMGRYFFSGGLMPTDDLFLHLQSDLTCVDHWQLDGTHYERTAEAWIDNLEAHRGGVLAALAADVGPRQARVWFRRWKAFFMGCSRLWGYRAGQDFGISHYLFVPARTHLADHRARPGTGTESAADAAAAALAPRCADRTVSAAATGVVV